MTRLISFMPDWLLFVCIAVFFLILYMTLDPKLKLTVRRYASQYGLYILLIIVLIYGWNKFGLVKDHEVADMNYTLFIVLVIFALIQLVKNYLYRERYVTTFFQANGAYGSCALYYDVGDYTVFYLGTSGRSDYAGFVLPWYFPQRIVVVPKGSWAFNGNNIVSTVQVHLVESIDLPEHIRQVIEQDSRTYFSRDQIYYGLFSEQLKTEDPKYHILESDLKKKDRRINELSSFSKGRMADVKEFVSDAKSTIDKMEGKSWHRRTQTPGEQ